MSILAHLSVVLAAATISSGSVFKSPNNGNFELLILHNNDMHARFEQTSQLSGTCTTADREAGKCYGGFPRVAHVVKEARAAAAAGVGPPVLYLNAGDTYTGTAWFTLYKWKIAAEFVNALKPDAVALGNNELTSGSNKLSPFLENLDTTILSSNVILHTSESNKMQKSKIFDVNGVKVGVVGYLTLETGILDSTGNIEYIDEIIALREEVAQLQRENVKIIIALGHSDLNKDTEIAREVDGIDIVIGGHKNNFFWNGTSVDAHLFINAAPFVVKQESGRKVLIVQSYAYNNYFGKLFAEFDSEGEIASYKTEPVLLDSSIPQDTESVQKVKKISAEFVARSEQVIGQTAVVLDGETCKLAECNLGNLITDAMMYTYALRFEGERWTDAPIAIIPGGAIAASISPSNRPASVTQGDLMTALPAESNIVTVTVNGTVFLQMLEHSVANYSLVNPTGQLLQFSGIRAVYDLSQDSGSRIVSAVVRCWACFVPEFFTIDSSRDYKLLMPASLADGAYGYTMLVGLPREDLVYDELTVTAEYIGLRSPVYPEVAGRIDFLNVDALEGDGDEDDNGGDDEHNGGENPGETDSATTIGSTALLTILLIPLILN